ncbi:MAG: hypothetical protein KF729_08415 [Sandaracinaceae bacterium]|nr:hypothetical protein [Sandaracinaceae bacterium]
MNAERATLHGEDAGREHATPGLPTRLLSLGALLTVAGGLGWLVLSVIGLFTDSWIAPANLSPDNDAVVQLHVQITRHVAEVERAEAERVRIDHQIAAIDASLARLAELGENTRDMFLWGADRERVSAAAIERSVANLRRQQRMLVGLRDRQRERTERTRRQLAEGIVGRRELDTAEQALDQIELQVTNNLRAINEAELELEEARLTSSTLERSAQGRPAEAGVLRGRMPEVVSRQESTMRIELEVIQLQAERRGLVAMRDMAERNLVRMREALEQVQARPLYRATQRSLDVAFVPYEQLDGVRPGDDVVQCTWGIFACHHVGTVREVIPGEVVTPDPWGELARGQFVVLHLTDHEAVRERILRVSQG